jgi:hypothetical protein
MSEPEANRVLTTIALSLAIDDAEKALRRALELSTALTQPLDRGSGALSNSLQALTSARRILQEDLKDG